MNSLTFLSLLLCVASTAALKDCRVWVHNDSPVPLMVEGPNQRNEVLLPGEQSNFASNTRTRVNVYRWCPHSSGVYKQVRMHVLLFFQALHAPLLR